MNKHGVSAFIAMVALVVFVVVPFSLSSPAESAAPRCTLTALGDSQNLKVSCVDAAGDPVNPSDIDVTSISNGVVTVTVDRTRTVVRTVIKKVPGMRITIRPAPVVKTKTIRLPGDTRTVYVKAPTPRPRIISHTVTLPQPTKTVTVTPKPARQAAPSRDTMDTAARPPRIDFGDGRTTIEEVGIGLLTILAALGLILLMLYAGYIIGYKDKERKDTNFMRALLDAAALRRTK